MANMLTLQQSKQLKIIFDILSSMQTKIPVNITYIRTSFRAASRLSRYGQNMPMLCLLNRLSNLGVYMTQHLWGLIPSPVYLTKGMVDFALNYIPNPEKN